MTMSWFLGLPMRGTLNLGLSNRVGHGRFAALIFWRAINQNRTFYLDESTRCRLRELGQFPDGLQPAGTHAQQLYPRWLIDLTWNSSRLEGNTYSLLETWQFLHTGQPAGGKDASETQMILNHKAAIDLLVAIDLVNAPDEIAFNHSTICKLQTLLSENLLSGSSTSGRLRVPDGASLLHKANAIEDPFEQALFAMVHVPRLQPFEHVNKRRVEAGGQHSLYSTGLGAAVFRGRARESLRQQSTECF